MKPNDDVRLVRSASCKFPEVQVPNPKMRAMSLTALGLLLAPAAAYRLALPVAAAAQPRAACSMAGRAARVCSIDMMQNLDGTGSFRTVQEYPCDLDVKIIGDNEGPFVNDMVTLCAERTGQKEADVGVAAWSDVVRAAAEPTGPPTAPWLEAPSPLRTAAEPSYSRSGASPRRGPKRWFLCVCPIQVRDGVTKASTARSRCGCTLRTRIRYTTCTPRSIATRA